MAAPLRARELELDRIDIISPDHYAANGYPHAEWALLRERAPIYRFDRFDGQPFWAVTRHEDIIWISRQPQRFLNAPRLAVFEGGEPPDREEIGRHLLVMDPPQHGVFRRFVSNRFTPNGIARLAGQVDALAAGILDSVATDGAVREIDFVEKVSSVLPIMAIADILGVPREDWPKMFRWTNEAIGSSDPEYRRPGETPEETGQRARVSMFEYFAKLAELRRKEPQDDLISVLAHATVDGAPLRTVDLLIYYNLIVIAGNETTRNATSGGLLAFIENPQQLEQLRRNPALLNRAVEEVVRWTSPVIQFCRTTTEDVERKGQRIPKGESFCLFYPSANRDESVFADPWSFRIDRDPNPHLAFGIGEHFCLGANLARLELRAIFRQLAERLDSVELAGPVQRLRSSFIGGIKHMPIRYSLRSSRA